MAVRSGGSRGPEPPTRGLSELQLRDCFSYFFQLLSGHPLLDLRRTAQLIHANFTHRAIAR
jgi:hypothetical protein